MKIILLSLILLIFTSIGIKAQSCKASCLHYANFVKMAQADTVKNTQTKLNYYRAAIVAARDCHCPDLEQSAYSQIDTLFILIDAEKRRAEAQSQTILEQQNQIKIALIDAEAANEKNMKIVNAMDFYDDKFALAFNNGKYGFIDKDGKTKLGFRYYNGGPFDPNTGFAEMRLRMPNGERFNCLIDTFGSRYQLFNINEEYIILLNKQLIERKVKKAKKSKRMQSILKDYEFGLLFLNIELAYNLNKNKEKIALNFQGIKKSDVLEILDYLAKDSTIKDRIGVLMLSGDSLDIFPEAITEFENIVNIDIYWTNVKTIPKTIDRLTKLKKIKLPISVTEVPSSIYNLESLETLNLADTELETLPETIENLKNLKELRLPGYLVSLPENIGNLKNLETLDLFFTELEELPEAIGELKNLKRLELPMTLKQVPSSIYDLEHLDYLYLSGINQNVLPEAIGNLKKLKDLTIDMPVERFPSSLWNLEHLEILNLYKTRIIDLPEGIGNLKNLEMLNLPRSLETLPESIGNLINLKQLNLVSTRITKLPEGIGNLKSLEKLFLPLQAENLPEGIGNLKNLEFLYLPTSVETLPEGIGALINLKELNIVNRRNFKKVPDVSKLKKLEDFYLTLHKDENYVVNLERLKVLQEKLPGCLFHIKNEKGEDVNVRRE
jgi:Leucine-rich repeat (LRR) protein